MKFATLLAAIMASSASATQNHEAIRLVSSALARTEEGTTTHAHLSNALSAMTKDNSQLVHVPIDEKRDLTLKVSPTWKLDIVNSVTLKSFRKIVGYDTFNSIRTQDRAELKDTSDYYNVTVSMMIQRKPAEVSAAPQRDPYAPDGAASLAATLDKGFPYDE
jgi:hypothetical protein